MARGGSADEFRCLGGQVFPRSLAAYKGSDGAQMLPLIAPSADDGDAILLPKTSCSVFNSTNLHYILKNLGVSHLVVTGQLTNQCVESAVRDAADLGYLVTVVSDACAAKSANDHEMGLYNMRGFARVMATDQVAAELLSAAGGTALRETEAEEAISSSSGGAWTKVEGGGPPFPTSDRSSSLSQQQEWPFFRTAPTEFGSHRTQMARALYTSLRAANVKWLRFVTCDLSNQIRAKAVSLLDPAVQKDPQKLLNGVNFVECLNGLVNMYDVIPEDCDVSAAGTFQLIGDWDTLAILPYNRTHAVVHGGLFKTPNTAGEGMGGPGS